MSRGLNWLVLGQIIGLLCCKPNKAGFAIIYRQKYLGSLNSFITLLSHSLIQLKL